MEFDLGLLPLFAWFVRMNHWISAPQDPQEDIKLLEDGLSLLKKQLYKAKTDLDELISLKNYALENTEEFIDDLINSRLKFPRPQEIVQVPSIEWILAQPRSKGDFLPPVTVNTFLSPLDYNEEKNDPDLDHLLELQGSDEELRGNGTKRPVGKRKVSTDPVEIMKKRMRAERERERRRRKKEIAVRSGQATSNTGRVSGVHYLKTPPVLMTQKSTSVEELVDPSRVHHGYQCNLCLMEPILGILFTCQDCPDHDMTDLCERCFNKNTYKSVHHTLQHKFKKISNAKNYDTP